MSQYFTAFNFHDIFFIWNYCLGIVVHSGPISSLLILKPAEYQSVSGLSIGFYVPEMCSMTNKCAIKVINYHVISSNNEEYL